MREKTTKGPNAFAATLCFAYVSLKDGQNTRDQITRGRVPRMRVINFSVHSIHS